MLVIVPTPTPSQEGNTLSETTTETPLQGGAGVG
jgi:hypothetical protein